MSAPEPAPPAGPIVVVIGGASGIGQAVATRFATDDPSNITTGAATVVIADRNLEPAEAVAATIGAPAWAHWVDVADEASVEALFAAVAERAGPPDVVVNCAGIGSLSPITDLDLAEWRSVIDIGLTGAFLVIKHAGRHLTDGGSIVTIASLNAVQPAVGMAAYCSAKAGVAMLTQVAAMELGARGIRVNAVAPGLIDTPLVAPMLELPGVAAEFTENTPLGRPGQPDDVAHAVHFLSAPGSWTNGHLLVLDGGAHTRRYPDVLAGAARAARGPGGSDG